MKLIAKFGVAVLALTFTLAPAKIAGAGTAGAMDQYMKIVPVVSWSEPGVRTSSGGAVSVNRDLGAYHKNDVNQFGDDRAYDSSSGHTSEGDYQANHWTPETYGLMGDYWYDSR